MRTLDDCAAGVLRHAAKEHLGRVMQGYWLLQARVVHALPADARGQGRKSNPTLGLDLAGAVPAGFEQWLDERLVQTKLLARATAFNYMAAARAIGITADMSEADAVAHAEAKLAEFTGAFSSLYKLPKPEAEPTGEPEPPPAARPEDEWVPIIEELTIRLAPECPALRALPRMPLETLEGLRAAARTTLDHVEEAIAAKRKGGRA